MPRLVRLSVAAVALGLAAGVPSGMAQSPADTECRSQPVVMISTSWCGYCRRARQFFNANAIDFEEIDAEQSTSEGVRMAARRGVPLIVIGGSEIRGFNERRIRSLLCMDG